MNMNYDEKKVSRIIENAIEITDGNLPTLQNHFSDIMGRSSIIENFIVPWAIEAEREWENIMELDEEMDYYDFIDKFVEQKMEEYNAEKPLE